MSKQAAPARRAAHRVLRAVHDGRRDLAAALAAARQELDDPRDRALTGEIALGVLRWRNAIDHLIGHASTRPLTAISPTLLDLLRAATYQIVWLDRIPPRAAVADAVTLARQIGEPQATGFVNAVLRTLVRDPPSLGPHDSPLDTLTITLSHPRWLAARWLDRHGPDAAAAWARFNNAAAPVTLRPNLARITAPDLAAALAAHGVRTTPTRLAPHGLIVTGGDPAGTSLFRDGAFVIQDEASQLIIDLIDDPSGARVLDLCASPGNKTAGLAATMPVLETPGSRQRPTGEPPRGEGSVVAADYRPRRVALLARTVARLRLANVAVVRLDATAQLPFGAVFDRVLLDAPCSGLGTIRRDPDIRWRRTEADLEAFADLQLRMLERAAASVRPGGRLVYSTCSSEPEENEVVVARFLERHAAYEAVRPPRRAVAGLIGDDGYFRTLPFRDGVEAFFGAVLRRKA